MLTENILSCDAIRVFVKVVWFVPPSTFVNFECHASLAQSVARRSHNPKVMSSILIGSIFWFHSAIISCFRIMCESARPNALCKQIVNTYNESCKVFWTMFSMFYTSNLKLFLTPKFNLPQSVVDRYSLWFTTFQHSSIIVVLQFEGFFVKQI